MGIDELISKLKVSLVDLGTTAVVSYLRVQVPALANIPLVTKIIEYVTKRFLTFIADSAELGSYYVTIENHTREQAVAFSDACVAYEKAKGTANEHTALQLRLDAARKLISLRQ